MWKWLVLALTLLACSEGDELEAPMLGDCANCGTAPVSGGGISGGSDASTIDAQTGDAFDFDASTSLDGIDTVDVGPVDFDAPFP